jgi:hypothetical protein
MANYYHINESAARTAHEANHMSDYGTNSQTNGKYAVEKVLEILKNSAK